MDFLSNDLEEYITEDKVKKKKIGAKKCEHGRDKYRCMDCGSSGSCEHKHDKRLCKECGGSRFCIHGKVKQRCKECGGSALCKHNKRKEICKECSGSSFCMHGKVKQRCKECGGSALCKHNKRKDKCRECGGSAFCKHGKRKEHCIDCGGSGLCKSSWCEVQLNSVSRKKYEGYCLHCFMHLFPDKKVARNYKTKEKDVVDRVRETYPNFDWVHDKKVQDGCSKRRPDLLLDLGSHIIIIEIDEDKHSGYDNTCENKRLMELSQDVHHRPIVFIRFNPDKYIDSEGNTVKSCWRLDKNGVMKIMKTKEDEWNIRIDKLKGTIQYWIDNISDKTIEIVELFY